MSRLPDGSLSIKSVNLKDAGEYVCMVENLYGNDKVTHTVIRVDAYENKPSGPSKTRGEGELRSHENYVE